MKIINFYGGPGAGKSTLSANLFSLMKNDGYKVSLISESATDLIEAGQGHILKDPEYQVYVSAIQFKKIKDQVSLGTEYLITDSPMLHQMNFIKGHWLHAPMSSIFEKLMENYTQYHIMVLRDKPYSEYKRVTTDEESMEIQKSLLSSRTFDLIIKGRLDEVTKVIQLINKSTNN